MVIQPDYILFWKRVWKQIRFLVLPLLLIALLVLILKIPNLSPDNILNPFILFLIIIFGTTTLFIRSFFFHRILLYKIEFDDLNQNIKIIINKYNHSYKSLNYKYGDIRTSVVQIFLSRTTMYKIIFYNKKGHKIFQQIENISWTKEMFDEINEKIKSIKR